MTHYGDHGGPGGGVIPPGVGGVNSGGEAPPHTMYNGTAHSSGIYINTHINKRVGVS